MVHFTTPGYSLNEGPQIPYADMSYCLWAHRWLVPKSLNLEAEAVQLHPQFAFPQTEIWVDDVMRWGHQNRAMGRIIHVNGSGLIAKTLLIADESPTVATAFDNMTALRRVGTSRNSLLLRFQEPHVAMLNLALSNFFDYPHNKIGLLDYTQDCRAVAEHLNSVTKLSCPEFQHRPSCNWLAADVDMVHQAFIKRWHEKTSWNLVWRGIKNRGYRKVPKASDAMISPDDRTIIIRPHDHADIDVICKRFLDDMDKGRISKPKKIIFPGGENLRIPDRFDEWSAKSGIDIFTVLLDDKTINNELLDAVEPPPGNYPIRPMRPLEMDG